jgi:Spy/CpxP family protein refolding chaperone
MKNTKGFILAATFSAALMVVPASFGQAAPAAPAKDQSQATSREDRKAQMHERLAQELNLTADQREKMKSLHESTRSKLQALRNNDQLTKEEKKAQFKQLRQEQRTQMEALLTPEQRTKFQQIREQHKGKHGGHGGHHKPEGNDKT